MQLPFPSDRDLDSAWRADLGLQQIITHLSTTLEKDNLVGQVTHDLQQKLGVDRVLLYYFYRQWYGRVTFEALSDCQFSILGSIGPDECFNHEYAKLYLAGRGGRSPILKLSQLLNATAIFCAICG